MEQQTGEHAPRDLVAAALAGDVAAVELDDLRSARRDARHPRPQRHAVVPVADAGHDQQPPRAPQRPRNEIAAGGVFAAPGAGRHPVVHAAVAVRAGILEVIVAPRLRAPAPRAEPHGIHHAAAAAPVAAGGELESLGGLERLVARVLVLDVAAAPRAERRRVRHHPAAIGALRTGFALRVLPLESPAAARTVAPVALQLGVAARAAELGGRDFAPAHRAIASSTMRCTKALYFKPAFSAASASS